MTTEKDKAALDIIYRLKDACIGAPYAKVAWPHRLLHDAISEIETLRATLAPAVVEPVSGDIARLKGTMRYIHRQITLNHPGVLKVIQMNVENALKEGACSSCKGLGCNDCGNTGEPFNAFIDGFDVADAAAPEPEKAQGDNTLSNEIHINKGCPYWYRSMYWDGNGDPATRYVRGDLYDAMQKEWVGERKNRQDCEAKIDDLYKLAKERREPPADLSIGKQAEQIYEWCACLTRDDAENQIRGLLGRISGVSKEGE